MALLFLKSLAIGLAVAMPMGPMSVLVIRRTLARGFARGLEGGFGIATADAAYAAAAAFGLVAVTLLLVERQAWLQAGGGLVLIWLGWGILRRPVPHSAVAAGEAGGGFGVMLALTLANPATILSFAAIFASFGPLTAENDWAGATAMTVGVFLGSLAWWVVLTGIVAWLRARISPSAMVWLNRGAGAVIIAFGLVALGAGLSAILA